MYLYSSQLPVSAKVTISSNDQCYSTLLILGKFIYLEQIHSRINVTDDKTFQPHKPLSTAYKANLLFGKLD